jgi:LPPG:FO 2-phospho-L-lactate transferase
MIVALAGGVGGAKLASGLSRVLQPDQLIVVVNIGDDFTHLGLHISPDLDTVSYTLAGINNKESGWGRAGDTWNFMAALRKLGGQSWFNLGDFDLAMHVERTRRLSGGEKLSAITLDFCKKLGVLHKVIPASDDRTSTMVESDQGWLPFQDYFVRLRCDPVVKGFRFDGIERARLAPGVLHALNDANLDAVVLCPSNPFVSIEPILSTGDMRERLARLPVPVIAVSPIIAGKAVKGPALKMMQELGHDASAFGVAKCYRDILDGFVIDNLDVGLVPQIEDLGMEVMTTNTMMSNTTDQEILAQRVLGFAARMSQHT